MANLFKNYTASCTDATETTVYTVPAATTAVVIGCNVANTTTASLTADVKVAGKFLIKGVPLPAGAGLSVLDGKIILEATDTLTVTSSEATGDVDVIISVLEQT